MHQVRLGQRDRWQAATMSVNSISSEWYDINYRVDPL